MAVYLFLSFSLMVLIAVIKLGFEKNALDLLTKYL